MSPAVASVPAKMGITVSYIFFVIAQHAFVRIFVELVGLLSDRKSTRISTPLNLCAKTLEHRAKSGEPNE